MSLSIHAICRRADELLADRACSCPASGGATRAGDDNVSYVTCDVMLLQSHAVCRWAEELLADRACSCPASGGAARPAPSNVSL
jgi:hypothetical protein